MTKKKLEAAGALVPSMNDMNDPALMEATIRIAAALAGKFGVMNAVQSQGDEIAKAALGYARAVVSKVRG